MENHTENPSGPKDVDWQLKWLLENKKSQKGVFVYQEAKRCKDCGERLAPTKTGKYCGRSICLNATGC